MTVAVGFMLLILAGVLTFASLRSTYFILKFLAGLSWWGLAFYWHGNPFDTASGSAMTVIVIVVFFVGLALIAMPFWTTRIVNGKETNSGRFRLPFTKTDEELEEAKRKSKLPSRDERLEAYKDRVDAVIKGERIKPRRTGRM